MNCCAGPGAIKIGQDASFIEFGRNFALRLPLLEKSRIDPANGLYFLRRPRSKNDTIRLQAFMLGAILNVLASAAADVFVIGRFMGILKPPPTADIIDQDDVEIGGAFLASCA